MFYVGFNLTVSLAFSIFISNKCYGLRGITYANINARLS